MDYLFSLLFKYRIFFFKQGHFGFESGLPTWIWYFSAALLIGLFYYLYLVRQGSFDQKQSWYFLILRSLFTLLALFVLAQPTLKLSMLVPQQTALAIVVDDSRSMGIIDTDDPRGEPLRDLLDRKSEFIGKLAENFQLQFYRFGRTAERLESTEELTWQKDQTSISHSLEQVLTEARGAPLGGIVLFTDGAENSFRGASELLNRLAARRIPLHTVGLGPEIPKRDIEMESVSLPRRLLPGSTGLARIGIRHHGMTGRKGQLEVRANNTLVESREIRFPGGSSLFTEEVRLQPEESGINIYEFTVTAEVEENNRANNFRRGVIDVRNSAPKLLYVEGRPRWEYKFLRRALVDDESLQLESLLRTALNKFYRQGIDDETTLAAGFPNSREQLFEYRGLIIGDVESAFFSYAQMELIRDFVSERGGGLLMLGGGSTLADGGFRNTPIEEALPVWLDQPVQGRVIKASYLRDAAHPAVTGYGSIHPALQLAADTEENIRLWSELPEITDRNLVGGLKPGATVLAEAVPAEDNRKSPLLVSQRFGRGLSLVFLSGSSWRWQMLRSHEDLSHEVFWKQLLRWLVAFADPSVNVELERGRVQQNRDVRIRTTVRDPAFNLINNATVELVITTPSGDRIAIEPEMDPRNEGIYSADWVSKEDGLYRVEVSAFDSSAEKLLGESDVYFLVFSGKSEYFGATQKREFLEKIAADSGGRYYSINDVDRLPEEVLYTESRTSTTRTLPLWDMPANLILLLTLPILEWMYRRRKGTI